MNATNQLLRSGPTCNCYHHSGLLNVEPLQLRHWLSGGFVHLSLIIFEFNIKHCLVYGLWTLPFLVKVCVQKKCQGYLTPKKNVEATGWTKELRFGPKKWKRVKRKTNWKKNKKRVKRGEKHKECWGYRELTFPNPKSQLAIATSNIRTVQTERLVKYKYHQKEFVKYKNYMCIYLSKMNSSPNNFS